MLTLGGEAAILWHRSEPDWRLTERPIHFVGANLWHNIYCSRISTAVILSEREGSLLNLRAIVRSLTGFAVQDDNLLPVRRSKASRYFALVFSIISRGK